MSRVRRLVVVALAVLSVGWLLAPRTAPPLYDGLGFPDEAYRFVDRPAGTRTTPDPTAAVSQVNVYGGQNDPLTASSAEVAPQVSVTLPAGSVSLPPGTKTAQAVARPEHLSAAPTGGALWSNVYELSVSPSGHFSDGQTGTLVLRAATGQRPRPSISLLDGGHWTPVPTTPVGRDIYSASISRFGRYAVIGAGPLDRSLLGAGGGSSAGSWTGIAVATAVVLVVVALFLLGRRRRSRARRRLQTAPAGTDDHPAATRRR